MADIHAATSSYSSGTNDTYTTLTDDVDEVTAIHQNGPASAIIDIETVLGDGSSLPGSLADLATRLNVALAGTGKLNDFSATTKTTFPGTVSEGCTGASSFTASQLIRMHASSDVLESAGVTVGAGTSGDVVTTVGTQTITGVKTLTTPTIASFANATHDHTTAAGGGILTGNSTSAEDAVWSGSISSDNHNDSTASFSLTTVGSSKVHLVGSAMVTTAVDNFSSNIPYLEIRRDSTVVQTAPLATALAGTATPAGTYVPIEGVDAPSAGTYTYKISITRSGGGAASNYDFQNVTLTAFTVV